MQTNRIKTHTSHPFEFCFRATLEARGRGEVLRGDGEHRNGSAQDPHRAAQPSSSLTLEKRGLLLGRPHTPCKFDRPREQQRFPSLVRKQNAEGQQLEPGRQPPETRQHQKQFTQAADGKSEQGVGYNRREKLSEPGER